MQYTRHGMVTSGQAWLQKIDIAHPFVLRYEAIKWAGAAATAPTRHPRFTVTAERIHEDGFIFSHKWILSNPPSLNFFLSSDASVDGGFCPAYAKNSQKARCAMN